MKLELEYHLVHEPTKRAFGYACRDEPPRSAFKRNATISIMISDIVLHQIQNNRAIEIVNGLLNNLFVATSTILYQPHRNSNAELSKKLCDRKYSTFTEMHLGNLI